MSKCTLEIDAEPEKFGFSREIIRRFDLLNNEGSALVNQGCCTGCDRRVKKTVNFISAKGIRIYHWKLLIIFE